MFEMMSLSNDETERIFFFLHTLENSRVLIYLAFNEIQTLLCPCLRKLMTFHLEILTDFYS